MSKKLWCITKIEGEYSSCSEIPVWVSNDLSAAQELVTKLELIADTKPGKGHWREPSNEIVNGDVDPEYVKVWIRHQDPYGKRMVAYRALLGERADGLNGDEHWALHEVEKL